MIIIIIIRRRKQRQRRERRLIRSKKNCRMLWPQMTTDLKKAPIKFMMRTTTTNHRLKILPKVPQDLQTILLLRLGSRCALNWRLPLPS